MATDLQHQVAGQDEFRGNHLENRFKRLPVAGPAQGLHVVVGQVEIHLREGHLHFGDQHAEEGPALVEPLQQFQLLRIPVQFLLEGGAHAKPTGQQEAALGPAEHPGDRPQAGEVLRAALAPGRPAGDLQLADFFDRGDLLEEGHQVGVVVHQAAVVLAGAGRQPHHQLVPAGGVVHMAGDQAVLQHRRGDGFQVVERQLRQGILRGEHFPLLGDLDAAIEGAAGLGQDCLVGRAAAPTNRAPAAMEDAEGHAMVDRQLLQGNLGPVDLPVAR